MQKVYLLLRSNKQTGPYSLEELLQLNLKPFDLVWMEGRSAAWQYPSEIPSLKPYVPETPHADVPFQPIATSVMEENLLQATAPHDDLQPQNPAPQKTPMPKRVFVSIPNTYTAAKEQKNQTSQNAYAGHKPYMPPVEEPAYTKTEELNQATSASYAQSSRTASQKPVGDEAVHTNYSRSLNDVEEDYTSWVYRQKTKKKATVNPRDLVLGVLILAVVGGGYYMMSKPSVANNILPSNKPVSQSVAQPIENTTVEGEPKEILSAEQRADPNSNAISTVQNNSATENTNPVKQAQSIKTKNPSVASKGQTGQSVPSSQTSIPGVKTNPNIHDGNTDVAVNEPEVKQQPRETMPEKKKEKFGDMIKSIFSKKDRKDETKSNPVVVEDPKPANNRQASRRGEDDNASPDKSTAGETNIASLMEQVDISSNAPDNWMMGVKNLKITLRNRSNVTLQTASVLVNYYNENNELLEKKLVYFSNIAPKGRATAAAPDSKFADHVDFKLTSVSAKEDRYAKNLP